MIEPLAPDEPEPPVPVIESVVVPTPAFELTPRSPLELGWLCDGRLRRQVSKSL